MDRLLTRQVFINKIRQKRHKRRQHFGQFNKNKTQCLQGFPGILGIFLNALAAAAHVPGGQIIYKAGDYFARRTYKITDRLDHIFDKLSFENVVPVAEQLMREFRLKKYDRIEIVYNRFKNAATQQLVVEQFLPILPPSTISKTTSNSDYIFEPNKQEILNELVPKTLKIQLYKVILDSWASEQGARMTAMHKATDNATEILKQLRLSYNKARQAAITNEILEIVGGAEALKG